MRRLKPGCKAIGSTVVLLCCLMACGKDAATIWSTESNSPDGRWVAIARTDQYGGPGTAGIQTTVFLKQTKGRPDETKILLLSQGTADVDLRLNWLTPAHLEIIYRQSTSVDFEAIKCDGIDISVRESSSPRGGSHPST